MRRTSKLLTASAVTSAAALVAGMLGGTAYAATTSAATLTGGTGTHTSSGVLYAKQNAPLTLNLTTTSARCVVATNSDGTVFASTSVGGGKDAAKTSWTLGGTAIGGSGSKSISVVAFDNQNCQVGPGAAVFRTYTAANAEPTLSGVAAPAAGTPAAQNGWYRGDVVVNWTCASVPAALGLRDGCATASTVEGEGADLSAAKTVTDNVGNSKTSTVSGIQVDRTEPTTSLQSEPSGWYADSVDLTLVPGSDLSGVAATHYTIDNGQVQSGRAVRVTGEGSHIVRYWSVDVAGNVEVAKSATVNIDLTDPTITSGQNPVKNSAEWNNGPVTVTFTCQDEGGSGIASCTPDRVVATEGAGQPVEGVATDGAGRTAEATHLVNIDLTNPTISGSPDREAVNGWYNDDVVVTFTCADPGTTKSGVQACPSAHTFSAEVANQSVSRSINDLAGNSGSTEVTGISIDRTAPVTGSDAPTSWQNGDVTVNFTPGTDLSGIAGTFYSVNGADFVPGSQVTISAEGVTGLRYYSVDVAGNPELVNSTTVSIDRSAPTVDITSPATSSTTQESVVVTATAADANGITGVSINNAAAVAGTTEGTFSRTVDLNCGINELLATATDGAGKSTTSTPVTVTRTCVFTKLSGFYRPVDMGRTVDGKDIYNTLKAGQTVPLKFNLRDGDREITDASVVKPRVERIACPNAATTAAEPVEETSTNPAGLHWDGTQWVFNWGTKGLTAGTCYRATVTRDGTWATAYEAANATPGNVAYFRLTK